MRRLFAVLLAGLAVGLHAQNSDWSRPQEILARISPPKFPAREFDITQFGAVGDDKTDCTTAIAGAVAACAQAGGGQVRVPDGVFLTGTIHLRSNVELHLANGATLNFSTDPKLYLPAVLTRYEGMECYNYSPLIYAYGQTNVAITGGGTLDGQAGASLRRTLSFATARCATATEGRPSAARFPAVAATCLWKIAK